MKTEVEGMVLDAYIETLEQRMSDIESEMEKCMEDHAQSMVSCQTELATCKAALAESTEEATELKSKLEEFEKECEELEAKVDTLEIENKGLAERLANERMARIAAESAVGVSKNIVAMADAIKECMVKPETKTGPVSVRFTRDDGGVLRGATMIRELI